MPKKREDLTGQVFNRLTAVECLGANEKGYTMWRCKCICGGEAITRTAALKSGATKSCGCLQRENKYREDLTGQVFHKITVIEYAGTDRKSKSTLWKCKCECGKEFISRKTPLQNGQTKSCGCLSKSGVLTIKHGMSKHPVYMVWESMRRRCATDNPDYGGRGIKVCEEWVNSFETFYRDMGDSYEKGLTIERIDVDGDYTPENCKWATRMEQQNNRRVNNFITVFGERMTVAQAARKYNMSRTTLDRRLNRGDSPEDAVSAPVKKYNRGEKK